MKICVTTRRRRSQQKVHFVRVVHKSKTVESRRQRRKIAREEEGVIIELYQKVEH